MVEDYLGNLNEASLSCFNPFACWVFYDFINLTQVLKFTVNAQDIFTFDRLPLFTISFTRI